MLAAIDDVETGQGRAGAIAAQGSPGGVVPQTLVLALGLGSISDPCSLSGRAARRQPVATMRACIRCFEGGSLSGPMPLAMEDRHEPAEAVVIPLEQKAITPKLAEDTLDPSAQQELVQELLRGRVRLDRSRRGERRLENRLVRRPWGVRQYRCFGGLRSMRTPCHSTSSPLPRIVIGRPARSR